MTDNFDLPWDLPTGENGTDSNRNNQNSGLVNNYNYNPLLDSQMPTYFDSQNKISNPLLDSQIPTYSDLQNNMLGENSTGDSSSNSANDSSDSNSSDSSDSSEESDSEVTPTEVKEISEEEYPYITRGAMLKCSKGTHTRRLDLADDHGLRFSFKSKEGVRYPIMTTDDCITEYMDSAKANLKFFGVCDAPKKPDTETIHLKDQNGGRVKSGKKCDLCILNEKWSCDRNNFQLNGAQPININSTITCSRGGKITIESTGFEYEDPK